MKIHLYSVLDKKMGVFLAPFAAPADVEALRQITASMKDPQLAGSSIVQTPSDFALWRLGTMDDEAGTIDGGQSMVSELSAVSRQISGVVEAVAEGGNSSSLM